MSKKMTLQWLNCIACKNNVFIVDKDEFTCVKCNIYASYVAKNGEVKIQWKDRTTGKGIKIKDGFVALAEKKLEKS